MPKAGGILFTSAAVAALSLAWQAPASAQAADGAAQVAEVVVTAQKRSQKLQDVPISIEVVSGGKLEAFHASDFKSVMNYVPNVFVETTAGDDVIYIRGFGSPPANFSFDQSVSLYVDGVYAGRSRQVQAPFFDLERVEVLRGPQGALFGKNTPAGAVSIVSAGPTGDFQGSATAIYSFERKGVDLSGFVSGPITDALSMRLAAKVVDQDGFIHNRANGKDEPADRQALARLTIKYQPSETFDIVGKVDFGDRDVRGGQNVSAPLTAAQKAGTSRYSVDSPLGPEGHQTTSWMTSATANFYLGDYTITSVTGYSWFRGSRVNDFDQTVPGSTAVVGNTIYNAYPERFRQTSQEIRLLSPAGRTFEYVVGAYYDTSRYDLIQQTGYDILGGAIRGIQQTDFYQKANSTSVFGQATWRMTDTLRLVGSLRYTETEKKATFATRTLTGAPLRPITSAVGSRTEDNTDPSITVQYDLAPRVMVYATYGRGSKSGGFVSNTFGTTNATFGFAPEKSENYEAGIKSTWFDGTLVLNAAVYNTKFTDLQVSVYNPTISTYQTGNAASASSKGIEGAVSWYPMRNLDITGAAAYQDVKYDDYPGAACLATQPVTECNPASPASIAANNLAGSPLSYISKFSGNVQVHHKADVGGDLQLDTTVSVSGRSKYFNSDNQSPTFGLQKGYAKLDLRVQLAPAEGPWHVALVGKNLTNEKTVGSAFNLPAPITTLPRAILYLEETRNIAIEAGFRF